MLSDQERAERDLYMKFWSQPDPKGNHGGEWGIMSGPQLLGILLLGHLIILDWLLALRGPHEYGPRGPDLTYMYPFGTQPTRPAPSGLPHGIHIPCYVQGYGKVSWTARSGSYVGNVLDQLHDDWMLAPESRQGMLTIYKIAKSFPDQNKKWNTTFYSPHLEVYARLQRDEKRFGKSNVDMSKLMAALAPKPRVHPLDVMFPSAQGLIEAPIAEKVTPPQPSQDLRYNATHSVEEPAKRGRGRPKGATKKEKPGVRPVGGPQSDPDLEDEIGF
jgi:hypothetical protein